MKVKLRKFDGTYKDKRSGYVNKSWDLIHLSETDRYRMARLFLTIKVDKENKAVGVEKFLIIPLVPPESAAYCISSSFDGLGHYFDTDKPKMCNSIEDIRTNLSFIMEFAMKIVRDTDSPTVTACFLSNLMQPTIVKREDVGKAWFTYRHNLIKTWVLELLPKKLMKLTETKKPTPTEEAVTVTNLNSSGLDIPACVQM